MSQLNSKFLPIPDIDMICEYRFWSYVLRTQDENQCWNWIGGCTGNEEHRHRPAFKIGQLNYIAARVAYKINHKVDPGEYLVCHTCSPIGNARQLCVNPRHLFLGTYSENLADAASKGLAPKRNRTQLRDEDVRRIRELHAQGVGPTRIGEMYTLSRKQIHRIVTYESFADVT
jgi:hypothetical protein